ncbi:MAG: toll/interleukin-1 receptor domain-containing protein [Caldimonas sp.]
MTGAQIFISYRRDDAAGYARAAYDELVRHFSEQRVFIDVDDIVAGQSFTDAIRRAVGDSKVLLVLIGKRWLGERDDGSSKISEPGDFVAMEVAAGLAKGMRVIPLLLDGTTMPTPAQLPESLRALSERNALELGNTRFAADMDRLVRVLRDALGEPPSPPVPARSSPPASSSRALLAVGAAVAAIVLVLAAFWWMQSRHGGAASQGATPASAANASDRPRIDGSWRAEVGYDWPNARFVERFVFSGEGDSLHGSASFLGVDRGILEGATGPGTLRFVTRTSETGGGGNAEIVHRYSGRLAGDEIRFVMQTEGGSSAHVPVEFSARRTATRQ